MHVRRTLRLRKKTLNPQNTNTTISESAIGNDLFLINTFFLLQLIII